MYTVWHPGWLCDRKWIQEPTPVQLSHHFREHFDDNDIGMFDWIWNLFECLVTDLTGSEVELDCRPYRLTELAYLQITIHYCLSG